MLPKSRASPACWINWKQQIIKRYAGGVLVPADLTNVDFQFRFAPIVITAFLAVDLLIHIAHKQQSCQLVQISHSYLSSSEYVFLLKWFFGLLRAFTRGPGLWQTYFLVQFKFKVIDIQFYFSAIQNV